MEWNISTVSEKMSGMKKKQSGGRRGGRRSYGWKMQKW
jgi:hypothetical protein